MSADQETGSLATVTCVEFGRQPWPGELWRLYFADVGEIAIYCPECAEREFRSDSRVLRREADGVALNPVPDALEVEFTDDSICSFDDIIGRRDSTVHLSRLSVESGS